MKKQFLNFLCFLGLVIIPNVFIEYAMAHGVHHQPDENLVRPPSSESIYNLKSKWTTMAGVTSSLSILRGHPMVVAMGYTSCEGACPVIVEDMKRIEAKLPDKIRSGVQFVFFSFDSVRDTPTQLKKFATLHKVDLNQWTFFQGPPEAVREMAAVLGVGYKKDSEGNFDHLNVISFIDADGVVKFQLQGLSQSADQFETKLSAFLSKTSGSSNEK